MSNLFKVSEAASIAIHGMILMAKNPGMPVSAKEIAAEMRASEAHLAKVLQRLGKARLVQSTRGPKGGFVLGKTSNRITLLDVYEAIEGPLETITCLLGKPICDGGKRCCMGGLLQTVGRQVRRHLAATKLSDLANGDLEK
jgi:Rrf2 family protein